MSFTFGEVQIFVSDIDSAVDFYGGTLALELVQKSKDWAILNISGVELVLLSGAKAREITPYGEFCGTVLCLKSLSIEQDIDNLKKNGVEIAKEVQTVPQGKYAVISDPDGNFIELIQH